MMKTTYLLSSLTLASLLSLSSAMAASEDYKKSLTVTANILKTSINSAQSTKQSKIRKIDTLYLANQGAVFEIFPATITRLSRFNFHFGDEIVAPEIPDIPPVPEVEALVDDIEFSADDDNVQVFSTDGMELKIEKFIQSREKLQQLAEQKRDLLFESRDLQRELSDLNFQLKRADKEDKKQLTEQQTKVKKQLKALKTEQQGLSDKLKQAQQQRKQQQAEKLKTHQSNMKQLTQTIVEHLCLYGKSLKQLPKKQYVTIVMHDAGDKVKHSYSDKVMVFNSSDVNACARDNITAKQLLAKANIYQY